MVWGPVSHKDFDKVQMKFVDQIARVGRRARSPCGLRHLSQLTFPFRSAMLNHLRLPRSNHLQTRSNRPVWHGHPIENHDTFFGSDYNDVSSPNPRQASQRANCTSSARQPVTGTSNLQVADLHISREDRGRIASLRDSDAALQRRMQIYTAGTKSSMTVSLANGMRLPLLTT